jgi:TetR/AcrR family transcriptional regulator, repressor for uid operon
VDPEAREARRRQILDGARRCFTEKGFHAASTADISEAAGVSVANLYQYFASKQDLVLAIAEQDLEGDFALGAILRGPGRLLDRIAGVFEALADQAEQRDVFRLRLEIYSEAQRTPEMRDALAAMDARLTRGLAVLLHEAQTVGEIAPGVDPEVAAALIMRILDGFYLGVGAGLAGGRALLPHLVSALREVLPHADSRSG